MLSRDQLAEITCARHLIEATEMTAFQLIPA